MVMTRIPVPATASATRCMIRGSAPDIATISTEARVRAMTSRRSCRVPSTGTEEIRRCFLAGSSSSRATGRNSECGSCIIRWMRKVPR
jgi:hypothetical protein